MSGPSMGERSAAELLNISMSFRRIFSINRGKYQLPFLFNAESQRSRAAERNYKNCVYYLPTPPVCASASPGSPHLPVGCVSERNYKNSAPQRLCVKKWNLLQENRCFVYTMLPPNIEKIPSA